MFLVSSPLQLAPIATRAPQNRRVRIFMGVSWEVGAGSDVDAAAERRAESTDERFDTLEQAPAGGPLAALLGLAQRRPFGAIDRGTSVVCVMRDFAARDVVAQVLVVAA